MADLVAGQLPGLPLVEHRPRLQAELVGELPGRDEPLGHAAALHSSRSFMRPAPRARSQSVSSRDTRREENQKLFRKGNEGLHDIVENHVNDWTHVPFLCECAAEYCRGRVQVQLAEWEAVASQPNHFLMVAGHQRSEGEQVVGSVGEYDVVQKPE